MSCIFRDSNKQLDERGRDKRHHCNLRERHSPAFADFELDVVCRSRSHSRVAQAMLRLYQLLVQVVNYAQFFLNHELQLTSPFDCYPVSRRTIQFRQRRCVSHVHPQRPFTAIFHAVVVHILVPFARLFVVRPLCTILLHLCPTRYGCSRRPCLCFGRWRHRFLLL